MYFIIKKKVLIASYVILCGIIISLVAALIFLPTQDTTPGEECKYTVTFYNNKGIYFSRPSYADYYEVIHIASQDNTIYKTQIATEGHISAPTPPTNKPYVFLGWYQDPECTQEFIFGYHEIQSDINLYAKWGK